MAVLAAIALLGVWEPDIARDLRGLLEDILGTSQVAGLEGPARLERVTDGDTLVVRLNGREEKLRLIGIDTPEKRGGDKLRRDAENSPLSEEDIKRLGEQASRYTEALVQGQQLYLERDTTERDRYGRLLAYVYVPSADGDVVIDGENFSQVNLAIVEGGWAEPLTVPPNVRYADDYVAASRAARRQNRGMWRELP